MIDLFTRKYIMKIEDIYLANNLNQLINQKSLSITMIAREVGMNKSTLHNYCNGVIPRNILSLKKLANFLDISLNDLIFENNLALKTATSSTDVDKNSYVMKIYRKKKTDLMKSSSLTSIKYLAITDNIPLIYRLMQIADRSKRLFLIAEDEEMAIEQLQSIDIDIVITTVIQANSKKKQFDHFLQQEYGEIGSLNITNSINCDDQL